MCPWLRQTGRFKSVFAPVIGGAYVQGLRRFALSEPVQDVVCIGHEPAFKHSDGADNLCACRFTLRAITRIAQKSTQPV